MVSDAEEPIILEDITSDERIDPNTKCDAKKTILSWWPTAVPIIFFIILII
jgi:hypothetical protein